MEETKLSTTRKWAMIGLLTFFGCAIAKVPYMREVYYDQVIDALNINNTQLGILSSAVGIASMVGYFFGGFLADKFSSKKMIILSGFFGGMLTLWYMTFPSFLILLFIHAAIAMDGTLIFWAAYIRILRLLGGSEGQGKYYGFAEGIRAAFGIILPLIATVLMEHFVSARAGVKSVLLYYAICYFATSILAFFIIVDVKEENSVKSKKIEKSEYIGLFKAPGLWLVSLLIFGTYTVFSLQSYTTPYLTEMSGLSNSMVSTIAIFRQYGVGIIAMPLFGIVADKLVKSPSKTCIIGLTLLIPCSIGLLVNPMASSVLNIILVLAIGFLVSGTRGVYYATQGEAQIPIALSGTAAGIISTFGFAPDAFIFTQVGRWLDKYPAEQAYNMIWVYMCLACIVAICAALGILVLTRKHNANEVSLRIEKN